MKSLINFIKENNSTTSDIFKNISSTDFEWQSAYSDSGYQAKCKKEVIKFADDLYEDIKPYMRIEQLYRDTYKKYLSTNSKATKQKIDDEYDNQIKLLDKYGWSQFESKCLEQGWWVFMYWVKNKKTY